MGILSRETPGAIVAIAAIATAVVFLTAAIVRGFDPDSAIAAFVALVSAKYIVKE